MEPPEFHPALGMESTRAGEVQQNVLLEVLSYCRFLHAAVQRLEQKIDSLQPEFRNPEVSTKLTVPVGGAQLSRSLAQRLGPSPQTKPQDAGNVPPHGIGGKRNKSRRPRARGAFEAQQEVAEEEEELPDQAVQKNGKVKRRRKKRKCHTAVKSDPEETQSGEEKKKNANAPVVVKEKRARTASGRARDRLTAGQAARR